ncbi:hypothetical protein K8354_11440 [Polaribacter litorisediminis]|uniref:hypothetical protein n=1 Tax=Polaribacter litorisediminis TaxID=1908341 RepID=UPI001CBBDE83|nr:hypothetical protein [Polaribacter litorisediminis]UAM96935.1 hypothetical protein K8354_11440 [Polaribacter litorisediminis]
MKYKISINPLVDFSKGTDAKKRRIVKDSKNPPVLRVGWYQTPRACIKKSLSENGNNQPIIQGLEKLKNRIVSKPQQINNKLSSLEAMRKFLNVEIPEILKNHDLTLIKKRTIKSTFINGVEVLVSPDIVFTIDYKGEKYIGGVKIHLSKGSIFDLNESKMVATILHKHITEIASKYNAKPLTDICFSIDVFGETIVSASKKPEKILSKMYKICDEVKHFWNVA